MIFREWKRGPWIGGNRMFHASRRAVVASGIVRSAISYTQSGVYTGCVVATNTTMTNGVTTETQATGINGVPGQFVRMDLGAAYPVNSVIVGCDFNNTLSGGFGKTATQGKALQYSLDGASWTTFVASTPTFVTAIQAFTVSFTARYIRIINNAAGDLAVTEFYAS